MLDLTKETLWGLYALHYLAKKNGLASGMEIARHAGVPLKAIAPILRRLRDAGLLRSLAGHGYRLNKTAGLITIEEVEGLFQGLGDTPVEPCTSPYDQCAFRESCPLSPLCREAHVRAQEAIRSFTIADLRKAAPAVADCAIRSKKRRTPAAG